MEVKPFHERLKKLRLDCGFSQREVEKRARLAGSSISRLERNKRDIRNMRFKDIEALATTLGTTVDVLLGLVEQEVTFPLSLQKLLIVPLIWRRHFQDSLTAMVEEIEHLP